MSDDSDFIPGIRNSSEMSEVGIFDQTLYDEIAEVNALDAIHDMRELMQKVGMMC